MKKLVILIFILIMCVSLVCCDSQNESTSEASTSSFDENTDTSPTESENTMQSETVNEDKAYLSIERVRPSAYKKCNLAIEGSSYVLKLEVPMEWNLSRQEGGYKIIRGGKHIGNIMLTEESDSTEWKSVATREISTDISKTVENVEKRGTGDTLEFRYRWQYIYNENDVQKQINIYVNLPEVYQLVSYRMFSGASVKPLKTTPGFGTLSSTLDGANMLIVGNSFVGTSNIGRILQDLFNSNGKENSVTPMSIGMGNIGKYSIDEGVLSTIKSGAYDVLFISGFYGRDDSASLRIFKEACEIGGATLVVLPAHNENLDSALNSASACDVPMINWKGELDEMIDSGIDKAYLCINDSYSHSTPLAGFVGAHMIYCAIYGEAPESSGTVISEYELSLLGDYAQTGSFYTASPNSINYIK